MRIDARTLLPLCAALWPLVAAAQEDLGAGEPEVLDADQPIRYRVEVILFANEEMDPTEEFLEVAPHRSRFYPERNVPVRRYVDEQMLRSIERQVDGPIADDRTEGMLPPFSDTLLAIDNFAPDPADLRLRILDTTELQLRDEFVTLERLDAYTPLFHGGWEQDGLGESEAIDIELALLGSLNPSGAIRLHVSRYLHARVDLAYRPPVQPPITFGPGLPAGNSIPGAFGVFDPFAPRVAVEPIYYLYEERRLFRDQINYLDHPAFGVILIVTLAPEPELPPVMPATGIPPSA